MSEQIHCVSFPEITDIVELELIAENIMSENQYPGICVYGGIEDGLELSCCVLVQQEIGNSLSIIHEFWIINFLHYLLDPESYDKKGEKILL